MGESAVGDDLGDARSARQRMWADRPGPAVPLVLLALVVVGGIVLSLLESRRSTGFYPGDDDGQLLYWTVATLLAYALMMLIARQQGYRQGIWVSRKALVIGGAIALAVIVATLTTKGGWFLPGDLTVRGNLPLLAITVGVLVWAWSERRPGLWALGLVLIPLTLLANLYDMENLLFRLGIPDFENSDQIVNLAVVAAVLLIAAAAFGLAHLRAARIAGARS